MSCATFGENQLEMLVIIVTIYIFLFNALIFFMPSMTEYSGSGQNKVIYAYYIWNVQYMNIFAPYRFLDLDRKGSNLIQ